MALKEPHISEGSWEQQSKDFQLRKVVGDVKLRVEHCTHTGGSMS